MSALALLFDVSWGRVYRSLVEWLQESKLQLGDVWKYIPLITGMSTAEVSGLFAPS